MLNLANQNGYPFRTRLVSVTQSSCPTVNDIDINTLSFEVADSGGFTDRVWTKVAEANLLELATKRFTPGWRVKSIDIGQSPDVGSQQSIVGAPDGDGFRVTITLTNPAAPGHDPTFCLQCIFHIRAIVLEGPADDMALDQTKRWKNMFPSN